jgi:hypothetical protein
MRQIPLTQGKFATVDDEDFEYLNQWSWCVKKSKNGDYYAIRTEYGDFGQRTVSMHRVILGLGFNCPEIKVDHADLDTLNNQKENLRKCSNAQNLRNRTATVLSRLQTKGVRKRGRKYEARITNEFGKLIRIGLFCSLSAAAKAYNEAAIKYHGEFARLNEIPE